MFCHIFHTIRFLDGCRAAQRLPYWNVPVSQLSQTQMPRATAPRTRCCRKCTSCEFSLCLDLLAFWPMKDKNRNKSLSFKLVPSFCCQNGWQRDPLISNTLTTLVVIQVLLRQKCLKNKILLYTKELIPIFDIFPLILRIQVPK